MTGKLTRWASEIQQADARKMKSRRIAVREAFKLRDLRIKELEAALQASQEDVRKLRAAMEQGLAILHQRGFYGFPLSPDSFMGAQTTGGQNGA